MNRIFVSALMGAILLLCFEIVRFSRNNSKQETLVIGMMSGWAPFMSINNQGDYEGFDVDVAQELARRMGRRLVLEDKGSLAPLLMSLEIGSIDCAMSGLDITQKRRDLYEMTPYAGENVKEFALVFWEKVPDGIKSISDLSKIQDSVVCVEAGLSTERYLDTFDGITKKPLTSLSDMILDIRFKKSKAAFLEPSVVTQLRRNNLPLKVISVHLPNEFQIFGMGIACKKLSGIAYEISQKIESMKLDGTMEKLERKWLEVKS